MNAANLKLLLTMHPTKRFGSRLQWAAALVCAWLAGCGDGSGTATDPGSGQTAGGAAGRSAALTAELAALAAGGKPIEIDGSSSLYPVTEAVAEEFEIATGKKIAVRVAHAGTGGGFKRFLRSEIDICDASRPITVGEMQAAQEAGIEYIEVPVCYDALTVAVHPSNRLESITTAQLKTIWRPEAEGQVTRWNQVDPAWPDAPLVLFGAGTDSGTFEYFTEAICGKSRASRGDYTASEDDNTLVQGIAGNKSALGYVPFAYFIENSSKLKALAVDWERDDQGPVKPDLQNVADGKYNPLARPLFIYVNRQSAARPEVRAFVHFYLEEATSLVTEVKYLPLPQEAYTMARERFDRQETGSAFAGVPEVGVTVQAILQRSPRKTAH
jgi:phosphate transport system substrate-binding protein